MMAWERIIEYLSLFSKGEYPLIAGVILLIVGGSFRLGRYSVRVACRDYKYCRFVVFIKQLDLMRKTLNTLKYTIRSSYAKDLLKYDDDNHVSSKSISKALNFHRVLMDSAFSFKGKKELVNLIITNNIPVADTASFKLFVDENFKVFETTVWDYAESRWDDNILYLSFESRRNMFLKSYEIFKYQFSEFLIEARDIGTKQKERQNGKTKRT